MSLGETFATCDLRVNHIGLVLYVQKIGRECVLGIDIWRVLGNVFFCVGIFILLERMFWLEKQWGDLERCFPVYNLMYFERKKCLLL